MATPEEDTLKFSVAVDIQDALKSMLKHQRQTAKSMMAIARMGQKHAKESKRQSKESTEELKGTTAAYKEQVKSVEGMRDAVDALRAEVALLGDAEKKQQQESLGALEKELAAREEILKAMKATTTKASLVFGRFTPEKVKAELKEAGEALKEPLSAFLSRDLKGIVSGSMKGAGAVLSRSVKLSKIMSTVSADALNKRAEKASAKGKAAGGARGLMTQAGGAGMKGMAGLMKGMGSMMSTLSTIAPLLSAASAGVVGLIKMFIDADAMVKDFNKGIMESASSLEFLEKAGGSADLAVIHMKDSLEGVRLAATDATFNNALGITKDTHSGILNILSQEGVAFGNLAAEAGNTVAGMKALTQSIVTMGVGYSRSLGVPLQEITTLQAEMVREMGNGIETTSLSFANLTRAAAASGIAGNKFFNTVRAASADLGLWNLRLDTAVDLLGKLGKIMGPRAAQAFFQTISTGFKNMGRLDLVKQTLMAGPELVRKGLKEDIIEQQAELAKQIKDAGSSMKEADILKMIQTKGYRGADEAIRGVTSREKIGTLRDKAAHLDTATDGSNAKGTEGDENGYYALSQASREIQSIPRQMDILASVLERNGGSLLDITSVKLGAVADANNISVELADQLHGFALAVDAERNRRTEIAQKAGDTEEVARIAAMSSAQITAEDPSLQGQADAITKSQAEAALTVQDAIKAMSKEQGQLTMAWTAKLENFMDWFLNQFYSLMLDIWEGIMTIVHPGETQNRRTKRSVLESKIPSLLKALNDSGGDAQKFKEELLKGGSAFSKELMHTLERGSFSDSTKEDVHASRGTESYISTVIGKDEDKIMAAATAAIKDKGKLDKIRAVAESGGSLEQSLGAGGVSDEERRNAYGQATWQMTPEENADLAQLIGDFKKAEAAANAASGKGPAGVATPGQPLAPGQGPMVEEVAASNEQLATISQDNQQTQQILEQQGVKLAPATLKEEAKGMEASMLSALRVALFEYYMYSGTDRGTLLKAMATGGVTDPREMSSRFGPASAAAGSVSGGVMNIATPKVLPATASGGMVTGIANGLAVVAAQGEGLASVGRGERISSSSGGGGGPGVNVTVNGVGGRDLANLIEGKVVEGIREYKRREKLY